MSDLKVICGKENKFTLYVKLPLRIEPPATPPFRSSTSEPGLFTSNDLWREFIIQSFFPINVCVA